MRKSKIKEGPQCLQSVFVLVPPNFDPPPDFHEARATAATLRSAPAAARPGRVVYLSTIGAQTTQSNLLTQHTIIEQVLGELSIPITFLRARMVHGELELGCRFGDQ